MEDTPQVRDDKDLLNLMMADNKSAPPIFQPTNYWQNYENILIPELNSKGLRDFRRRKNSVLSSFGATDLLPISTHLEHLPVWGRDPLVVRAANRLLRIRRLHKLYRFISRAMTGASLEDVRLLHYELARGLGTGFNAVPVSQLEASIVGNPEDVFSVDGKMYTTSILYYYIQYAYCSQYMNFDDVQTVMELGSGVGKQIEVIKKLHPEVCFLVFDIAPQLYVCEQYLSTLFPGSVVPYRQTREMTSLPDDRAGKIFIFGNWKLADIDNLSYDLFINSASFQEMEPHVVLNYLDYVDRQATRFVFLHQMMEGKNRAETPGEAGVLEPTTLAHYKKGLRHFNLVNRSKSLLLAQMTAPYEFSFWERS